MAVLKPWFSDLRVRFEYHIGDGPSWVTRDEGLALVAIAEAAREAVGQPFGQLKARAFYALREVLSRAQNSQKEPS